MPCSHAILDDGRLVLERWWGEVRSVEFVAHDAEPFGGRAVVFVSLTTACTWLGADSARNRSALEGRAG